MINEIIEFLKDKKIAILGFGLEGKSTYKFIKKYLSEQEVTILFKQKDEKTLSDVDFNKAKNDEFTKIIIGEDYLNNLEQYDLIIKSPGISLKDIDLSNIKDKITSQLEMFLEYSKALTIGITGTKGKSTTSSLIYDIIKKQNKNVELLGNIGIPIFEEIEKINKETIVVLEISSHALEYIKRSPNISIILNIYEEHLDHYKTFQKYIDAKFNILKFQKENDIAIFNLDNKNIEKQNYNFKNADYAVTMQAKNAVTKNTMHIKDNYICYNNKKMYCINDNRKLKGNHNLNNIMFVLAVSNILKLDINKTIEAINEFNPLEHRLEYVGTFNKIQYYNDSIATIPESTIESIKALKNINTLIVRRK